MVPGLAVDAASCSNSSRDPCPLGTFITYAGGFPWPGDGGA